MNTSPPDTSCADVPMEIKSIRMEAGLTQQALSDLLGIPKRTIEDWESGHRTPPAYVIELIRYRLTH